MNTFITLENNLQLEKQPVDRVMEQILKLCTLSMTCLQYASQHLLHKFINGADTAIAETEGLEAIAERSKEDLQRLLVFSFPLIRSIVSDIFYLQSGVPLNLSSTKRSHLQVFSQFINLKIEFEDFLKRAQLVDNQLDELLVQARASQAASVDDPVLEELQEYIANNFQLMEVLSLASMLELLTDTTGRVSGGLIAGARNVGNTQIPITMVANDDVFGFRLYQLSEMDLTFETALPSKETFANISNGLIFLETFHLSRKEFITHLKELVDTSQELAKEWRAVGEMLDLLSDALGSAETSDTPAEKETQEKIANMTLERLNANWQSSSKLLGLLNRRMAIGAFERVMNTMGHLDLFGKTRTTAAVRFDDL